MKLTLLFGVLICLVVVNARHYGVRNDESLENNRYPIEEDRRDNDDSSQKQDLHLNQLLEEEAAYIRSPPPPQPQWPYSYATQESKSTQKNAITPRLETAASLKDIDQNRIWGVVVSNENDYDDGSDFSRPLSFEPIVPKKPKKKIAPNNNLHKTTHSTEPPKFKENDPVSTKVAAPGKCKAAILSCCGTKKVQQCFENLRCGSVYRGGTICKPENIKEVLESFKQSYGPINSGDSEI